jgi:hypothetical protein
VAGYLNGQVLVYANVMVGNNSASVVADAYIKGMRGYDINTLV